LRSWQYCSLGRRAAAEHRAEACALIPADLALLTPLGLARLADEYLELARKAGPESVGLVRCKEGTGTNMVFVGRQHQFTPAFEPDSFAEHMRGAAPQAYELRSEEAAFDIDRADDFRLLQAIRPDCGAAPRPALAAGFLVEAPLADLTAAARDIRDIRDIRDRQHGTLVTYSRKVFIPLTQLCRDVCHYCTFAKSPSRMGAPYMSVGEAVAVAARGAALGCKEALLTLGERPELRYRAARVWLAANGFETTLQYLAHVAAQVRDRTGLLPHINAGCMSGEEMAKLRPVSASMGLMLESAADRLCEKGGPHYGSPDKQPSVRLATIVEAGKQKVPFTTGILIGIGETRVERRHRKSGWIRPCDVSFLSSVTLRRWDVRICGEPDVPRMFPADMPAGSARESAVRCWRRGWTKSCNWVRIISTFRLGPVCSRPAAQTSNMCARPPTQCAQRRTATS
jgi:FO synthase